MKKGDRVRDIRYGNEGIIHKEYDNFWAIIDDDGSFLSTTPDGWLKAQAIPFTQEQVSKQKWFSILCDSGGSIWSCQDQLEQLQ